MHFLEVRSRSLLEIGSMQMVTSAIGIIRQPAANYSVRPTQMTGWGIASK
jgi:hypothetical protein